MSAHYRIFILFAADSHRRFFQLDRVATRPTLIVALLRSKRTKVFVEMSCI